jgi:hypothetical protein
MQVVVVPQGRDHEVLRVILQRLEKKDSSEHKQVPRTPKQ